MRLETACSAPWPPAWRFVRRIPAALKAGSRPRSLPIAVRFAFRPGEAGDLARRPPPQSRHILMRAPCPPMSAVPRQRRAGTPRLRNDPLFGRLRGKDLYLAEHLFLDGA